jgi:type VI secretion system secreted protein VgrG
VAQKVNVAIEIDGSSVAPPINSLSIKQTVFHHHSFELRWPVWERENFFNRIANDHIGKEIKMEISSGADPDGPKNYFQGIITHVGLSKQEAAFEEIVYQGYSRSIIMDDGPHAQSFLKKSSKDIVKDVSGRYNIDIKTDPAYTGNIPYTVQYNETGHAFLARLAATWGEWFYFDGVQFYFGKPHKESAVELIFGKHVQDIRIGINAVPSKFKLLGYEYLSHKFPESASDSAKISGLDDYGKTAAKASDEVFRFEPAQLVPLDFEDKAALDHLAKQRKATAAGNYVTLHATCDYHVLKPGAIIQLKSDIHEPGETAAKKVDYGEFRIIEINHFMDGQGAYIAQIEAIPAGLETPPLNPYVREPLCEVQPAEVLDNHDSEKLGRVEVQLWWQKPRGEKTPWIRVAASGAGSGHGAYFVPEKGDQVLVGFEHNNPAKPYVIGSLYHGKAKPSGGNSDPDNNNKELRTKSGNRLFLCDKDGGDVVIIEDGKKKNVITLSVAGDGKISIVSGNGDISIEAKNISLKATENMTLSAGTKMTLDTATLEEGGSSSVSIKSSEGTVTLGATTDMNISGKNLNAEGSQNTSLGAASATTKLAGKTIAVEGGTMVDVKGGTIKLN